jgi:DNA adenine methylase
MKYMGSKQKIKKYLLPILLENKDEYDFYVEPFCGGLSLIEDVTGIKKYASDINPYLIIMWEGLKLGLDKHMEISKDLYSNYRNLYNKYNKHWELYDENGNLIPLDIFVNAMIDSPVKELNLFNLEKENQIEDLWKEIFLIGWVGWMGSFNGRFFDGGYSGKTDKRDYVDEQIRNTLKQIPKIQDITFVCQTFEKFVKKMEVTQYNAEIFFHGEQVKCIVYCDPPYKDTKQYAYSKQFDYEEFYNQCRKLHNMGHKVFISEYQMPDDFKCVWEMEVTNSMNTVKTYKPVEKLFTL